MIKIVAAQHSDIQQMIEVSSLNLVRNNRDKFSDADFAQKGFLIVPINEEKAQNFIDDPEALAQIAKEGDEVVGYLTGQDVEKTGINFTGEVETFEEIKDQKNFYYTQIAKKPEAKDVGRKLVVSMLDEAKKLGYENIICRIVQKPFYNKVSTVFHERLGFENIGTMLEDGATLGVYLKRL